MNVYNKRGNRGKHPQHRAVGKHHNCCFWHFPDNRHDCGNQITVKSPKVDGWIALTHTHTHAQSGAAVHLGLRRWDQTVVLRGLQFLVHYFISPCESWLHFCTSHLTPSAIHWRMTSFTSYFSELFLKVGHVFSSFWTQTLWYSAKRKSWVLVVFTSQWEKPLKPPLVVKFLCPLTPVATNHPTRISRTKHTGLHVCVCVSFYMRLIAGLCVCVPLYEH